MPNLFVDVVVLPNLHSYINCKISYPNYTYILNIMKIIVPKLVS